MIDSTVNLFQGKIKKWKSLANAVLRKINTEKRSLEKIKNDLTFSIPEWLYLEWQSQYGQKSVQKILEIYQQEPGLDLRVKDKY